MHIYIPKNIFSKIYWLIIICGCNLNLSCTKTAEEPLPVYDSVQIGLVAHYPMDKSQKDLTGNNPDFIPVNTSVDLSKRGNFGEEYACYFKGNPTSYLKCPLSNNKVVIGSLTISFWAKETGPGTYSPRLFEFWPGNYGVGFYWFNWYQGRIKWAGPDFELSSNEVLNRNQWYHFVVSVDIYSVRMYCNGKLFARQNQLDLIQPLSIQLPGYFEIGRLSQKSADAFEGAMRDFRIYNRALSENEIDYLYKH